MEAEAGRAGADGYIEKGTSPKKIIEVVREVWNRDDDPTDGPGRPELGIVPPLSEEPGPDGTGVPAADGGGLETWRNVIASAVEHVVDLADAFSSFGRAVRTRVGFERAGYCVAESAGFRVAALCGPDDNRIPLGTFVPIGGVMAETLDRGSPFTIDDTAKLNEGALDKYLNLQGVRSYAAFPMLAAGKARALVGFSSDEPDAFDEEEIALLGHAVREAAAPFYMLWCLGRQQAMAEKLEEAGDFRSEWHRIVRHDLRSPLTVITGFADTMRSAWNDLDDEKKLSFLDAIARGADAMNKLLGDMDDVDRIESDPTGDEFGRLDLGPLVRQTVDDVSTSAGRVVITHIPCEVPQVLADEDDQRRVMSNLLENAFKFSTETDPVEVTVAASGAMLHVSVRDYGAGIAPVDQKKLFQKFSRVAQNHDGPRVAGTGLGLFICRSIVEAHGGRIWVESAPGVGTTIHYTVPIAVAA